MYKLLLFVLLFSFTIHNAYALRRPKLISPLNGHIQNTVNPEIKWDYRIRAGIHFEVKIAEDAYFNTNVIVFETSATNLRCTYPYLRRGKTYFYTIRAVYTHPQTNRVRYSSWTHSKMRNPVNYQFGISADASGHDGFSPIIISPEQKSETETLQPVFKWHLDNFQDVDFRVFNASKGFIPPVISKISYRFMIAGDPDFRTNNRVFNLSGDVDTFLLSIPVLQPGKEYYWRVMAIYYDPVSERQITTEWSSLQEYQVPASFSTSAKATGKYSFNEGMPEEEVPDTPTRFAIEALATGEYNNFSPAVSMDGRTLAFISDRLNKKEIYVKSLELLRPGGESQKTLTQPGKDIFNPFFLHNDIEVVFFANLYSDESWHLFSTNRGTSVTILTLGMNIKENKENFNLFGSSSTDGKIIFSARSSESSEYMMYLLDLKDDSKTLLRPGLFPDIRDDDKIIFSSNETGNYEIWTVNIEGRSIFRPTILSANPYDDYDPVFSPDGTKIAFTSNRSGNSDIWVMNSDGSGLQQITFHPMVDRRPQWVDQQTLVFQSNRTTNSKGEHVYSIFMVKIP